MKKNKLIITLFGSTGDLVAKKILPSIAELIEGKLLPENMAIFALGRKNFDTDKYLEYIEEKNPNFHGEILKKSLGYLQMDISNLHDFLILKNALKAQADKDTVFVHFLALSQELTLTVSNYLSVSEIVKKDDFSHRIIIEKPFGTDIKTAKILKKEFWKRFDEKQLYRIDHYLGKEMVKKMYELRFYNDKVLNFLQDEKLEKLSVIALEKDGILDRGDYYDKTGATRDMIQNHLLQLVSLALMDKPNCEECYEFIDKKVAVLKSLKLNKKNVRLGQYKSYFKEKNVSAFSKTETLSFLEFSSKKRGLKNVKINVLTAKKADEQLTELVFEYSSNKKLELNFFPNKEITLIEGDKRVKLLSCKEVLMPYARLILDAFKETKRYFVRYDEIESSWAVLDKVLKGKRKLFEYDCNKDIVKELAPFANQEIVDKLGG